MNADAYSTAQAGLFSARFNNEFNLNGVQGTASHELIAGLETGNADLVNGAASVLMANGADVRTAAKNAMKVTSLHAAAAGKWIDIAKILLEHGADPNARQMRGYVPLHEIAGQGSAEHP